MHKDLAHDQQALHLYHNNHHKELYLDPVHQHLYYEHHYLYYEHLLDPHIDLEQHKLVGLARDQPNTHLLDRLLVLDLLLGLDHKGLAHTHHKLGLDLERHNLALEQELNPEGVLSVVVAIQVLLVLHL
jgi:hypothetical protein|uniref:Uncharacterized protein n=1 Tax=Picea glauca TaxID=3330 RepID=A0A101LWV7_PICGL|nr:hypothetical protein ABT39_MTgene6271 [Picea glauca]QHR87898.1 hypothetical protein Q903MT_gene1910 [Picea sitchensis]